MTMTIGTSTYGGLSSLLASNNTLQNQISTLQEQTTTGLVSQSYAGLASVSSRVLDLTAATDQANAYTQVITNVQGKASAIQTALTQMQTVVTNMASATLGVTSSTAQSVAQQAQQALTQLGSLLNTSYAGDYIFAGADTANPPVTTVAGSSGATFSNYFSAQMSATTVTPTTGPTIAIAPGESITIGTTTYATGGSPGSPGYIPLGPLSAQLATIANDVGAAATISPAGTALILTGGLTASVTGTGAPPDPVSPVATTIIIPSAISLGDSFKVGTETYTFGPAPNLPLTTTGTTATNLAANLASLAKAINNNAINNNAPAPASSNGTTLVLTGTPTASFQSPNGNTAAVTTPPAMVQIGASEGVSVDLTTAAATAIGNIMSSLAAVANGTSATGMQTAGSALTPYGNTLAQASGQIGLAQDAMTAATASQASMQTLLATQLSGLTNVNMASAISQLQAVTNQLEASYKVLSMASSLNLASYL